MIGIESRMRNALWSALAASALTLACSGQDENERQAPSGDAATRRPGVAERLSQVERAEFELGRAALRHAARLTGRAEDALEVVEASSVRYPRAGRTAAHFKLLDPVKGTLVPIAVDASGQTIDAEALHEKERAEYEARNGRLHPRLRQLLLRTQDAGPIQVTLWLKTPPLPEVPLPSSLSRASAALASPSQLRALRREVDRHHGELDRELDANVAPVVSDVASRLAELGAPVTTHALTPLIVTELGRNELEVVGSWPEVAEIDLTSSAKPELDIVRSVIHTQIVHSQGFRGAGVEVGIVEVVSGGFATDNPFLAGVTQDLALACPDAISPHVTLIAGIIHSSSSTIRGVAPQTTLRAFPTCDGNDVFAQDRATAAANWGARILSVSWGDIVRSDLVLSANDRFFDGIVINRARTVVKSAGNLGSDAEDDLDGAVTSPGLAYNVVTVGGFDDANTTSWGDDSMFNDSSWGDPLSLNGDRQKPEIVAPAVDINGTSTSAPWFENGNDGTSYAAPIAGGVAALAMNANAGLEAQPEAVKAILMASAIHNIEADARLSERDGAGGLDAQTAVNTARELNGNGWDARNYNCSAPSATNIPMNLSASRTTRVVIAWSADPAYSDYANRPNADLDLLVLNPSGAVVGSSVSRDNTYEIVEFRPTVTATHTLRIVKTRCNLSPRRVGAAWYIQ